MTGLEIFVINLERAPDRWAKVSAALAAEGLSATRSPAVDASAGEHLAISRYDEAASLARRGVPLMPGELGCFASHYRLWQRLVAEDRPAMILEDDAGIAPGFATALELASELLPKRHMIRLAALQQGRRPRLVQSLRDGYRLVRHNKGPGGTQAYALSPRGAAILLADCETWFEPVDDHLDAYWRHGLAALAIEPYRVSHDDQGQSFAQASRAARRTPGQWLRRKLHRRLDRLRAYAWLASHPPRPQ
ncbi:MAG: glycosyltransferase family 25 protein [Rhodospirillales bacterium]